jgi:tRNA G18 (ribose-2'-O)-methylase SpoU
MDYQKNYYQKNKQKYKDSYNKELKQIYYQQNKDKILATVKEYNIENKNKYSSYKYDFIL